MSDRLTFSEYFAGIGLVGLGLQPDWELKFANDIDEQKYEMYKAYFGEDSRYMVGDIYKLDPGSIPTTTLATASFPCIDLSLAGYQSGINGKHSGAFWGFVRILEQMGDRRPPLVMLENVVGWLTSARGRDFRESIEALNSLGYVCDAILLNAHHFTPQSRPRLFVIGSRMESPASILELNQSLTFRSVHLKTSRLVDSIIANHDLKWMSLSLPEPPPIQHRLETIIEAIPDDDPRWWPEDKVQHIYEQLSDLHRSKVVELVEGDKVTYSTVYKRVRQKQTRAEVRTDGLAGCLRTPSGGSSKQIVFAAGRGEFKVRWMTAREYARLQGVPDEFPIDVPYLRALWGFGDAVCVPAINWISKNALLPLAQTSLIRQVSPA